MRAGARHRDVEAEKYIRHVAKRRGLHSAVARSILKDVSGIIQLVDKGLYENHELSPGTSTRVIVSFLSKPKGSECRHNASIFRKAPSTSSSSALLRSSLSTVGPSPSAFNKFPATF